jgi:hypothetical protein
MQRYLEMNIVDTYTSYFSGACFISQEALKNENEFYYGE